MAARSASRAASAQGVGTTYFVALLAWLLPGAGHFYLGLRWRAAVFFSVVFASLTIGCLLGGELYEPARGQPLTSLAGFACMGSGVAYFVLQHVFDYSADVEGFGFEYGKAFILTAGLMNILLVLDVLDIGRGDKE